MSQRSTDESTPVWYLIGTLAVGGAERTLVDLVSRLDDRFEPVIRTIAEPGPLADAVPKDVPVRSLGARSKVDVRVPLRFAREIRRERPPLLQSFLFFDNTLARLVGLASPETNVITGVRAVPKDRPSHREWIDRSMLRCSDAIVSNSEAGAEWTVSRGASADRVSVIHNGRDVEHYNQPVPDGYRDRLSIPEGPVVGTIGRLIRRKGHHDLIAAWPSVRAHSDDAQLVLVGGGPEYDRLQQQANRLGCRDSVHLLGHRDEIPELLALFDIFAFPSYFEGLPGALLEAMCAELPIVTTPVDGCSELIEDGVHGAHVSAGGTEALAQAIVQYLADSALADEHAASAHERAVSSFSLETMVENFEELYDCLITP